MRARTNLRNIILTAVVICLLITACNDGIFNFSDETGNLSFTFIVDTSGGDDISSVVFNFSNSDENIQLRRELDVSGDYTECYISRVNTGAWTVYTTVYLSDGTIAVERTDYFDLEVGETAIADLSYWSDGSSRNLDISWDAGTSTVIDSSITVDSFDTLITSFHSMGGSQSSAVTMIVQGSGFDTYLNGIKMEFPDSTILEYTGGWARGISSVEIESGSSFLTITADEYNSRGDYSLTVSDQNDVETTVSDNCTFDFDPESGYATISSYTGGFLLDIDSGEYEKNDSAQAGCYIVYIVEKESGTAVNGGTLNPLVYSDTESAGDLDLVGATLPMAVDGYYVLATIDGYLTQGDIDSAYENGTTNLSPDNLPSWLFTNFEDRINFVGLSVAEYAY